MKDPGLINTPEIEAYAKSVSKIDSEAALRIVSYTKESSTQAHMLSGELIARLLQILVMLSRAQQVLDVGTFTGYSALSLAEALPANGRVYTCDKDEKAIARAQEFFATSPHGSKIEVIKGDAGAFLLDTPLAFDLIFLDADKSKLKDYYEAALNKLNSQGILIIDDMLWRAEVLDPQSERAKLIHELNQYIAQDQRVINVLLPIRHGIQVVMLRSSAE